LGVPSASVPPKEDAVVAAHPISHPESVTLLTEHRPELEAFFPLVWT
jgi:hypothetical protein